MGLLDRIILTMSDISFLATRCCCLGDSLDVNHTPRYLIGLFGAAGVTVCSSEPIVMPSEGCSSFAALTVSTSDFFPFMSMSLIQKNSLDIETVRCMDGLELASHAVSSKNAKAAILEEYRVKFPFKSVGQFTCMVYPKFSSSMILQRSGL